MIPQHNRILNSSEFEEDTLQYSNDYPFAGYYSILGYMLESIKIDLGKTKILFLGTGSTALPFQLYIKGAQTTIIEDSTNNIEFARKKMKHATIICHNFFKDLPDKLKTEKFDYIVSLYKVHEISKYTLPVFLKSLIKNLTTHGSIIIGGISFRSKEDFDLCRKQYSNIWNDNQAQNYIIWNNLQYLIPLEFNASYQQLSKCSGVAILQRIE